MSEMVFFCVPEPAHFVYICIINKLRNPLNNWCGCYCWSAYSILGAISLLICHIECHLFLSIFPRKPIFVAIKSTKASFFFVLGWEVASWSVMLRVQFFIMLSFFAHLPTVLNGSLVSILMAIAIIYCCLAISASKFGRRLECQVQLFP